MKRNVDLADIHFFDEQHIHSYRHPTKQKEAMGKIVISMNMDTTKNMQRLIHIILLYMACPGGFLNVLTFTKKIFVMTLKLQKNHPTP